jgi:DNA topoisomerase-6 subunit B
LVQTGGHILLTPQKYSQDIVELSVSAWFYRNRAIAGFDNPARSLYVSVRELMENSLDACEDAQILPNVTVLLKREEEASGIDMLSQGPETFELVVKDNGTGIPRETIPLLLGKMLTGTKFTHKQSRGTFGLGGSLALLYGQVTTQQPIEIVTGQKGLNHGHRIKMRLDIENNTPIIIEEERIPKSEDEHGTMISFWLQGDWIRSKKRIIDYFTHTAIIVPYASLFFETPDVEVIKYDRVIEVIPKPSIESKPHPKGIDVEMLKSMIAATRKRTLKSFLMGSFQRVGATIAEEFLSSIGIDTDRVPESMEQEELVGMMNAMETFTKFLPPSAKTLSPVGTDVLETGVAYGGQLTPGANVIRFANRIPLLYDERSDVSYRVVRDLKLKSYGLRQEDPLTFMIHICSTKIPYKTIGKEYIADIDAVRREIELGFKDCLRELSKNLRSRNKAKVHKKRESRLSSYYRFTADTLSTATGREVSIDRLLGSRGGAAQ